MATDGNETTGGFSGQEWLRHFMEARGRMDAEVTWMTFVIGQAGAVMASATRPTPRRCSRR